MTADTSGAGNSQSLLKLATQDVAKPITGAAIFQVLAVAPGAEARAAIRALCGDLPGLLRAVGFRDIEADLSCVLGLGAALWDQLGWPARPAGLHPFQEIEFEGRHAVATPGDLLLHIRAARMDLCFELATQVVKRLGGAITAVDEVHGFRYFDDRDLIGFVDGTENPVGQEAVEATVIGAEDPDFAGGSYVIVQKYLHDLAKWDALPVEEQERIVGREKLSDIELDDAVKPSYAHNALTTITDASGEEIQIVRDNMPFGNVAGGEFGTYFIGYARSPEPVEQMLRNMFIGRPPGNYDRLLDVSHAVTGTLFFVPSLSLLDSLAELADPAGAGDTEGTDGTEGTAVPGGAGGAADPAPLSGPDGSLGIGSLRGVPQHE